MIFDDYHINSDDNYDVDVKGDNNHDSNNDENDNGNLYW